MQHIYTILHTPWGELEVSTITQTTLGQFPETALLARDGHRGSEVIAHHSQSVNIWKAHHKVLGKVIKNISLARPLFVMSSEERYSHQYSEGP